MRIEILAPVEPEAQARRPVPRPRKKQSAILPDKPEINDWLAQDTWFQELFQRVYDGAIITTVEGAILDANARASEFLMLDKSKLCTMNIVDVISGADVSLLNTIRGNLDNDRFTLINAFCMRQNKTVFPSETAVSRLNLNNQTCLCFFIRDITLRRKTEESLRKERNLLNTLIDNLPDFIYVKDCDSAFIIANIAVTRNMGRTSPDELIGKTDFDFHPHDMATQYFADEKAIIESGLPLLNKEEFCIDLKGNRKLILTTKVPLKDDSGQIVGIVGIGRDITEQRTLESQRMHAQKMESIGQLAAGIAHEINTPVQYVGDNLKFLRTAFLDIAALLAIYDKMFELCRNAPLAPEQSAFMQSERETKDIDYLRKEIPSAIDQSLDGIGRVARIVSAMKEFSHPDAEEKAPANLNRAIESTISVSRNEWKYVADVVTELHESLPNVPCLVGSFNQVILNLIVNAAHAIANRTHSEKSEPEKGIIKIQTRLDNDEVEIRVSDSGTGIPKDIRHRIFEPFFTTKSIGKGTGQGLTTCHSIIVKQHGGSITFETEENKGTTFIIRLPIN